MSSKLFDIGPFCRFSATSDVSAIQRLEQERERMTHRFSINDTTGFVRSKNVRSKFEKFRAKNY